jgi:hypothetical protein
LGISPASDCGLPTFRNPLSVPSSRAGCKVWSMNSERRTWYLYPGRGLLEPIGSASSSKPRPGYKYHVLLSLFILHTLYPALECGTDRGFRNVGKPQSDAGEIPKRIHTKVFVVCLHGLRQLKQTLCHYSWCLYQSLKQVPMRSSK